MHTLFRISFFLMRVYNDSCNTFSFYNDDIVAGEKGAGKKGVRVCRYKGVEIRV